MNKLRHEFLYLCIFFIGMACALIWPLEEVKTDLGFLLWMLRPAFAGFVLEWEFGKYFKRKGEK